MLVCYKFGIHRESGAWCKRACNVAHGICPFIIVTFSWRYTFICMHNKPSTNAHTRPPHSHFLPFSLSHSQALLWFCLSTACNSIEERRSSWRRHGIFTNAFCFRCGLPRLIGTIWKWILIRYYPSICEICDHICVNVFVCERVRVCTFGSFFLANSLLNCSFSATRWKLWKYFTWKIGGIFYQNIFPALPSV